MFVRCGRSDYLLFRRQFLDGEWIRLVSLTVENFRSITAARSIPISNLTTLVGPNNEGKSNILRALVVAMNLLIARRDLVRRLPYRRSRRNQAVGRYDWTRDFPLKLQMK